MVPVLVDGDIFVKENPIMTTPTYWMTVAKRETVGYVETKRYRSSITGQYVKKEYALSNPSTTVLDTRRVPQHGWRSITIPLPYGIKHDEEKEGWRRLGNVLADQGMNGGEIHLIREAASDVDILVLTKDPTYIYEGPTRFTEDTLFKVLEVGIDLGLTAETVEFFVTECLNRGLLFRERVS